jgi:hypothetical protein
MAAVRMNFLSSGTPSCKFWMVFYIKSEDNSVPPEAKQSDPYEHLVDEPHLYPEVSELFQQQDRNRYPCIRSAGDWHSLSTEEMYA